MQRAFEKIRDFLKEKFDYNSEQAEIWRSGDNVDAFMIGRSDDYIEKANCYGEVIRFVNQVASEYFKENYFNLDNTKLHDCPKCGEKATHRVNKKGSWACGCFKCGLFKSSYDHVKAIQAWEDYCGEYGGGWIPVSSGIMPEERQSIFAKFKGTDKWNDAMFEKISDEVNVTVVSEKGNATTAHAHTKDGKWSCDLLEVNKTYRVIAWQPPLKPYQPNICNDTDCPYNDRKECPASEGCAGYERKNTKVQTNADRIRSMSDEELAMNMMCPNENGLAEIECSKDDSCNCYKCSLKWLQSEVEE